MGKTNTVADALQQAVYSLDFHNPDRTIGVPPKKSFHKRYSLGKEGAAASIFWLGRLCANLPDFYNIGDGIQ